jgi:hypothetical protein
MLEGTQVLWEAKYSYYDLMRMRLEEGAASFDSEMQNEPVNPKDRIFDADNYGYLEDKYSTTENLLVSLGEKKRTGLSGDTSKNTSLPNIKSS